MIRDAKIAVDDIGTSTTLESNKSFLSIRGRIGSAFRPFRQWQIDTPEYSRGLDVPSSGRVLFRHWDLSTADDAALTLFWRQYGEFVLQFYTLGGCVREGGHC